MKIFVVMSLLVFGLASCQEKKETKKIKTLDNEPIYTVKIAIANPHEIYINNMPLERDYSSGSSTVELLINNFILKSGIQSIRVVLFPENGKAIVDKLGINYVEAQIYKYPRGLSNMLPEDRMLVKDFDLKEFMELSLISKEMPFEAEVPYSTQGWSSSVDLSKENQDDLMAETVKVYGDFYNLLNTQDYKTFFDKTKKRDYETDIDLYLNNNQVEDNKIETISTFKKITHAIPLENYKMKLYGNDKIVALVRVDKDFNGESALQAELKDGSTQIYELLLHRPKPGAPLEVIR